ncbi:MAG: transcriptional regulator [Methylocystis sp.]|nr:MAG: transcriptional regulator [Methylocystis sp.]
MTRRLTIAAGPALATSLAEQMDALGGYTLQRLAPGEAPAAPWPDALVLDAAFCDAAALAGMAREGGFTGALVVIVDHELIMPEADAALVRPFRFAELLEAIDASCPRREGCDGPRGLRLTEKEAAIIARLSAAKGAAIPKSELLADVWGYGPNVSTRTLETHIHRLRRKIEADPARPRRLLTEKGGYRLAKFDAEGAIWVPAPQKSDKTEV